jgi:hypothetical protein
LLFVRGAAFQELKLLQEGSQSNLGMRFRHDFLVFWFGERDREQYLGGWFNFGGNACLSDYRLDRSLKHCVMATDGGTGQGAFGADVVADCIKKAVVVVVMAQVDIVVVVCWFPGVAQSEQGEAV